tara:strand:- start:4243 stop:5412 length:1170 start_codon:yes stop_codon:yes gene_type:complete
METRTQLLDPTSHTASRTLWRIPAGVKYLTQKLRAINFRVTNNSSLPIYFRQNGIYELIKQISVENFNGVVIDSITSMDYLGQRMTHMENGTSQMFGRQMFQNMCLSVTNPLMGQLALTEIQGKDDATKIWAHIDISFALQYLQARMVANEGLQVVITWNTDYTQTWGFDGIPVLAFDEVLAPIPVDKAQNVVFNTIIPDRLDILVSGGTDQPVQQITRLNSFFQQYIKNLYYFNATPNSQEDSEFTYWQYSPFATKNEKFAIVIDGRKILTLQGIDTDAKKLASFSDWTGSAGLPGVASYYADITANEVKWGLYNPNLAQKMSGNLSFGALGINQFVNSDITIDYSGTSNGSFAQVIFFLAEVARVYNIQTGVVGNVTMKQPAALNTV